MGRRKPSEFILTEMNLDMIDSVVSTLNELSELLYDNDDMEIVGKALRALYIHTENGFEPLLSHEGEFVFTLGMKGVHKDCCKRVYEYRFRLNTYTNDITCIDKYKNEFTMPILTDALYIIRDKAIEYSCS